jgi:inorganic pyrophosphatase
VLGPAIEGGTLVRGVIVGLFLMEDEKGHDAKVVLSRIDAAGKPLHALTAESKKEMADFFSRYKEGQPGLFSKVGGWGSIEQGRAHVTTTHAFFQKCAARSGAACSL